MYAREVFCLKQSNRLQLHNLSSSSLIDWSKYEMKSYLHFDNRVKIEHVKDLVQDPNWVGNHAFLPFIHFEIKFKKYVVKDSLKVESNTTNVILKERKTKIRKIFFASHLESFIYRYYGDILNNFYNKYAESHGIDHIALAYRNNKKGLNNVDFAVEVFEFTLKQENAIIISLDFTSFFDKISHKKLKENLKTVLNCSELPVDFYKIYKSMTQFSYVNQSDIDEFLINKYGKYKLHSMMKNKSLSRIMTPNEYREFKQRKLFKHKKPFGIPQGSGMSAVCSNVHLIHFDQELKKWAEGKKALYRRYCDDLILVIPSNGSGTTNVSVLENEVLEIVGKYKEDGLIIQKEKTEVRLYEDKIISDRNGNKSTLDYLGFVTDGKTVKIREKSVFKYYCRAYRKAKVCKNITLATGEKYERGKLYKVYTHLGFNYKKQGNFISYANKAHKKMSTLPIKSLIKNQIKRHWHKIHRVMNS